MDTDRRASVSRLECRQEEEERNMSGNSNVLDWMETCDGDSEHC